VLVDYLPAVTHAPGIGRYARELVRALVRLPECPELVLHEVGPGERVIGEPALGLAGAAQAPRRIARSTPRRLAAWQTRLGLEPGLRPAPDVVHRVMPGWPPVSAARELLAVSELPSPGSAAEARVAAALARAHALVFSGAGRGELSRRFALAGERIHQAPVGCDHWQRDLAGRAVARERTLIVLGALRPERQPLEILAAFERLHRGGGAERLVVVGGRGPLAQDFERRLLASPARAAVDWRREARESEMGELVARAACLVHLSDGELTAVTPLEAFLAGAAVVGSRLPAFEEALCGEALLVERDTEADPGRLAEALAAGVAAGLDEARAERRRALARPHTWEANARATIGVWRHLARGVG
jgi:glycosyltransferase involved in cell wall biosynthesis